MPAVQEEFRNKKEKIKKELLNHKEISQISQGIIKIDSDQITAFRSGTDEKDGVLLIGGAGCVAHGWCKNREFKASGWGWLADEGSAIWVGQKVFQAVLKDLDGRGPKTLLTKFIVQKFKIRKVEDLTILVYLKTPTEIIPQFSMICDEISKKGDRIAKNILKEAGRELALNVKPVIEKFDFKKNGFPIVLAGSMFKSKIILDTVKKEIKKFAPRVKFIRPKVKPVIGAVKLAIEEIQHGGIKS